MGRVMKIERMGTSRGARAVAVAADARPAEAVSPPRASAGVFGIPENEFTPRVRDAIITLMAEVDNLRGDLQASKERLNEAEKNADQDQLLPMFNRRAFVRVLTRQISLSARHGTPSSLIYFDLDQFKSINDAHGHPGGDAVLQQFAKVLAANVRDSDFIGRLGGDEFGVLLSHADQTQAHKKADLLAQMLHEAPAIWNGQAVSVSFAYGAFEMKAGDDAEMAIARADAAMYAHKRAKR
jgi:diguanylate cyclase (GGDEF)-like protein